LLFNLLYRLSIALELVFILTDKAII